MVESGGVHQRGEGVHSVQGARLHYHDRHLVQFRLVQYVLDRLLALGAYQTRRGRRQSRHLYVGAVSPHYHGLVAVHAEEQLTRVHRQPQRHEVFHQGVVIVIAEHPSAQVSRHVADARREQAAFFGNNAQQGKLRAGMEFGLGLGAGVACYAVGDAAGGALVQSVAPDAEGLSKLRRVPPDNQDAGVDGVGEAPRVAGRERAASLHDRHVGVAARAFDRGLDVGNRLRGQPAGGRFERRGSGLLAEQVGVHAGVRVIVRGDAPRGDRLAHGGADALAAQQMRQRGAEGGLARSLRVRRDDENGHVVSLRRVLTRAIPARTRRPR